MKKLLAVVDQLANYVSLCELSNKAISEASVGWHIEHSCLVIIKITETIKKSDPSNYNTKFNIKKLFVFITGKFPRGRAQAPEAVMPANHIDQALLLESIARTKTAITVLATCNKKQFFLHPIFGNLNRSSTMYFLGIHTNHHIRILQDILK
jgi:hypothetical protein